MLRRYFLGRYFLRRYRKIKEDMPLSAAKIEDDTLVSGCSASKLMSFISFYLPLSSSTFMQQDKCHLPPSIFIYLPLSSCNKTNVIYLLLSSSISLYLLLTKQTSLFLQGKRNLRNLNYKIKQAQKKPPARRREAI